MFIWTAKLSRKKIALGAAAVLVCAAVAAAAVFVPRDAKAAATVSPKGVRTEEDRVAYLQSWGWQVAPQAILAEELLLPDNFGEEYADYLELQASSGFDLAAHAGQRVKRYSYEVLNYPGGKTGVRAQLLVRRGTVVGGEVLGADFLQGLEYPA